MLKLTLDLRLRHQEHRLLTALRPCTNFNSALFRQSVKLDESIIYRANSANLPVEQAISIVKYRLSFILLDILSYFY